MSTIVDIFFVYLDTIEVRRLYAMVDFKREAISNVIRKLRTEKKLSQDVISGLAGIGRSHLAMIETGAKLPNFETIWAIATAFDMHPYELVKLIEEESERLS